MTALLDMRPMPSLCWGEDDRRSQADGERLRERAVALHRAGRAIRAIADRLGVPKSTVQRWLTRAGCRRRPGRPVSVGNRERVRFLADRGLASADIAWLLGLDEVTVLALLREDD